MIENIYKNKRMVVCDNCGTERMRQLGRGIDS